MMSWSTVHLMFCEGPHDAAFLSFMLKGELRFEQQKLKLSELPYPLGHVLKTSVQSRALEDLRLDLAKRFFFPEYVLAREKTLVFVFSYGGSNRKNSMQPFLDAVFTLLAATSFSGPEQAAERPVYAYTIFADADARGESKTRDAICDDFSKVGDTAWLSGAFVPIKKTKGASQSTDFGQAATYVWRSSTDDSGTLEDLVFECLKEDAGLEKTLAYLDARFDWSSPSGAKPEQICAASAKRLKAALCVEGQHEKPGGSLAVILNQSALINRNGGLKKSLAVQDFLTFLTEWMGV